jgi:hypothetical protein
MLVSAVCKVFVKGLNRSGAPGAAGQRVPARCNRPILGHDNIDVTAQYAQVSNRLIVVIYDRAHPHANTFHNRGRLI